MKSSPVVYFLQVQPDGPIKIGTTNGHVSLRMKALQQSSPHILKWIGWFSGGRTEEADAHRLLRGSKLRNEWFYPTQEVLEFVKSKCPDFSEQRFNNIVFMEPERQLVARALPRWGKTNPEREALLKASGLERGQFHRWLDRRHIVAPDAAKRAADCAAQLLGAGQ